MVLTAQAGREQGATGARPPRSVRSGAPGDTGYIPGMRITGVSAYQIDLPLHEGSYKWSGGNSVDVFDSTVVAVETDAGITGYGEVCPLGPAYLPAYARGARTGIAELAPHILGADPRELDVLDRIMNGAVAFAAGAPQHDDMTLTVLRVAESA